MVMIKLKSCKTDIDNDQSFVEWHEWDGKYFCAKCALDVKSGVVPGVRWDSPKEIVEAIKLKYYGNNI